MNSTTETTRRPRWGRRVALVCLGILVVLLAIVGWVGVRAAMAASELETVQSLTQPVRDAVEARDLEALDTLLSDVQEHAGQAASLTGDPVWRAAEVVPFAGPNLAAVRTVSSSIADVSSAAVPLVDLAREIAASPAPGTAIGTLGDARPALAGAAAAFAEADDALAALPSEGLVAPVARGVEKVATFVADGSPVVGAVSQASEILPPMLGADGPRTLLVMIQNGAELRTAGGLAGSFVLLEADADGFQIIRQADSADFPRRTDPIVELPASTAAFYGDDVGRFVQNATMTPDFALTGALVSSWWADYAGEAPDAVLSIDLMTVAALVDVSGPLTLPDGTRIPADELEQRVLLDPYFTLDSDQQTAFQEVVTAAAMERILGAGADPVAWLSALVAPVEQGRVSAWSADASEQSAIASSQLGGSAARHGLAGDDAYAVYFNDATGGKMDSFLDVAIDTGSVSCRSDGRAEVEVAVTLTNTALPESRDWPILVTGGGTQGVAPGDISTDVSVAAPAGTFLGDVRVDEAPVLAADGEIAGFPMLRAGVVVSPGSSSTIVYRFVTPDPGQPAPVVLHTPLMRAPSIGQAEVSCR